MRFANANISETEHLPPSKLETFRSKNLRWVASSLLEPNKTSGHDLISVERKVITLKKLRFHKYILRMLFLDYLCNGKRFSPQIFNLVFWEKVSFFIRCKSTAKICGNPVSNLRETRNPSYMQNISIANWQLLDCLSKSTELRFIYFQIIWNDE